MFRDFPTFSRICIFFLLTLSLLLFSLLIFLFSLPLPCSAFHLSILSEVWLLNFLRWISTANFGDLAKVHFKLGILFPQEQQTMTHWVPDNWNPFCRWGRMTMGVLMQSWLVKWLADFASGRVVETYGGQNMFDPTAHVYCLYIAPYSSYSIRFRRYLHSWFIVCKCVNVCIHIYIYIVLYLNMNIDIYVFMCVYFIGSNLLVLWNPEVCVLPAGFGWGEVGS